MTCGIEGSYNSRGHGCDKMSDDERVHNNRTKAVHDQTERWVSQNHSSCNRTCHSHYYGHILSIVPLPFASVLDTILATHWLWMMLIVVVIINLRIIIYNFKLLP